MSQQINLFNPIFLQQKKVFAALPMLQALAVIVAGALLLTWYGGQRVAALERSANAGKTLLEERERRLVEANKQFAPRQKSAALASEAAQAEAELQSLHQVESVLRDGALGNTAGYAEYFRALARQNLPGLWLTGVSIVGAGNEMGLQGRAMQPTLIPNYIARLKSEPTMRGKTFARLDIARGDAATRAATTVGPATAVAPAPFVQFSLQSSAAEASQ